MILLMSADLIAKLSDTVRSLSKGISPAAKTKSKTNFLDADDDISEVLSVHELVSQNKLTITMIIIAYS